jgi:hypothetical protein
MSEERHESEDADGDLLSVLNSAERWAKVIFQARPE